MSRLREARDLIKEPVNWTTDTFARDGRGNDVHPRDDDARQWCAAGALGAVFASGTDHDVLERCARALFPEFVPSSTGNVKTVVAVNDRLGHEAVMQVYEKAIVEVEGGL